MSGTKQGSTDTFKVGSLKRRLDPITIALLNTVAPTDSVDRFAARLLLTGLNTDLTVHVAVAITNDNQTPIEPANYPVNPGTIQLIPRVIPPGAPPMWLRQVFQDPAAVDNKNHPLAMDIPFGWSFEPEGADEVIIDLACTAGAYIHSQIVGQLVVQVTVEYTGTWWDTKAIMYALGQVRLSGAPDPRVIDTGGE